MSLLLTAILLFQQQPEPSEAAKKARAGLDAVRVEVKKMEDLKERFAKLREQFQAGSDDEERLKKLAQMRDEMIKQFQDLRTTTIKSMDELLASTTEAIKAAPEDPGLLDVRSEAYLIYGKFDLALPDLVKLVKLRPEDRALLFKVARLEFDLNRYESAAEHLEAYLKKDEKKDDKKDDKKEEKKDDKIVEVRVLLAMCDYSVAKFEESDRRFTEILKGELNEEQRAKSLQFQEMARKYIPLWKAEQEIRAKEAKADDLPRVKLTTTKGEIQLELLENEAPNTVANFIELVDKKFYDGLKFHRVIPAFMAQGGDPVGNGSGGPGYKFKDEIPENYRRHFRGSMSMANAGPNTNGSQFFLTHLPTEWLNGKHTVFGRVIAGQDVVDSIVAGDAIVKAEVVRKRDHEYKVVKIEGGK